MFLGLDSIMYETEMLSTNDSEDVLPDLDSERGRENNWSPV